MRKKLFAVIMSAMMMITFMPSMAFADTTGYTVTNVTWNDTFTQVTGDICKNGTVVTGGKGWVGTVSSNEVVTTGALKGAIKSTVSFEISYFTGAGIAETINGSAYLYNLSNAKITDSTGEVVTSCDADDYLTAAAGLGNSYSLDKKSFKFTGATNLCPLGTYVTFEKPNMLLGGKEINGLWHTPVAISSLTGLFNTTVYPATYEAYDADGEYAFPISIVGRDYSDAATANGVKFMGTAPTEQKTKIVWNLDNETSIFPTHGTLKLNGKEVSNATTTYNAEDQKVEYVAKGFAKVEYKTYDAKAGKWSDWSETAPSMKNVGTLDVVVRVTRDGTTKTYTSESFEFKVNPLNSTLGGKTFTVGTDISKANLFKLNNSLDSKKFKNGVLKADEAAFAEFVKYITLDGELDSTCAPGGSETHTIKLIVDKSGLKNSSDVLKQFMTNYGLTPDTYTEVQYEITDADTYVVARTQTKTFHVKKAAKLKSKKTFKLKNDETNADALIYVKKSGNSKITVAKNGKVTVKKGLKKGTYKVKIKVMVSDNNVSDYQRAYDWKTLKVKVVK